MTAIRKPHITVEEYLVRERAAEFKSEYYRGEIFAMAGASSRHNRISSSLLGELHGQLKNTGCKAVTSDQRLGICENSLITYPDIQIVCGDWQFDPRDRHAVTNPIVIIEVLSPSTEKYDRGAKFRLYQAIPSLQEYVLVAQDEAVIDRFTRQADGSWALVSFVGLAAVLSIRSVKAEIPLTEIYADVTFGIIDESDLIQIPKS